MSAKESFSSRFGLLPFVAGAGVAMAALMVFEYVLRFKLPSPSVDVAEWPERLSAPTCTEAGSETLKHEKL